MKDVIPPARTLAVYPHPPDPVNPEAFYYWHCSRCGSDNHEHSDWEAAMDAAEQHICEEEPCPRSH